MVVPVFDSQEHKCVWGGGRGSVKNCGSARRKAEFYQQ